jgi:hypothetical protein
VCERERADLGSGRELKRREEKRREEKRRVQDVASQAVHAQGTRGGDIGREDG